MKYFISFLAFALGSYYTVAQQELSSHFMQEIGQATLTNPALVSSEKKEIFLPSVYYNLYTPDFNINQLFAANNNGRRDLNLLAKTTLGVRNRIRVQANALTFGYAYTAAPKLRLTFSHSYHANAAADVDGVLIKAVMNDYSKSIGKTISFDATLNGHLYHQLAVGGSYQYRENINLGARLKILKGITGVFTRAGQSNVTIDGNNYAASFNNNFSILGFGLDDVEELTNLKGILKQSLNLRNMGIGLDMGATYKMAKGQFSASIIDGLGLINWRKNGKNYTGTGSHSFSGINTNFSIFQGTGKAFSFNLKDTLKSITGLKIYDDAKYLQKLPTKIYLSALYNFTDKLQLGALIYGERGGNFPNVTDFMINASYKVLPIITVGGNWSIRNKRWDNIGLNLCAQYKMVQIYATTDNIFTVFRPYNHKSANCRLGVNLILNAPKIVEITTY
jgi:Family of unknown function (DUF5723)